VPSSSKAHVIIPTHSAHDTLRFAVLSALDQSLAPEKITIIGDGATQKVVSVAEELSHEFSIVEFLDKPKLGNRGENYRDDVIKSSEVDFISYLCDDDLYMPNHLEQMSIHLEKFDFAHPRPTFVNPDGTFFFLSSGIEIPKIRTWHRLDPPQNTISLTGASHTRRSYLSLEKGWDAGPPDIWTDLYMWVKFFSNQEVTTFTSPFTTTIKLMYTKNDRDLLNRSNLIKYWYDATRQPDQLASFQTQIETQLKENFFDISMALRTLQAVTAERDAVTAERDTLLASNSWRITKPLRKLRSVSKKKSR
jgi:glycosyltransferase involved in cell wall biosynthesis